MFWISSVAKTSKDFPLKIAIAFGEQEWSKIEADKNRPDPNASGISALSFFKEKELTKIYEKF